MTIVSQETRRRLLNAAARVFAERGYADASVRAIAAAADVNTAAISYHFRGKEELYRAVLAALDDPSEPAETACSAPWRDPRQQLVTIIWSILMRETLSRSDLLRRIHAWELLRPTGIVPDSAAMPDTEFDLALAELLPELAGRGGLALAKNWLSALVAVALKRWPAIAGPRLGRAARALGEANRLVSLFCDGVLAARLDQLDGASPAGPAALPAPERPRAAADGR